MILGSLRRSSPADLGGSPKLLFVTNTASNVTRCSGCSTCSTAAAPPVTGGQPNITGSRVCRDGRLSLISGLDAAGGRRRDLGLPSRAVRLDAEWQEPGSVEVHTDPAAVRHV